VSSPRAGEAPATRSATAHTRTPAIVPSRCDLAELVCLTRGGACGLHRHLYIDGAKAGNGRVDVNVPIIFFADETTDVGSDTSTPVCDDYTQKPSTFSGRVGLGSGLKPRSAPPHPVTVVALLRVGH
jgi:hypothetical protein